jgi:hypothetical protein
VLTTVRTVARDLAGPSTCSHVRALHEHRDVRHACRDVPRPAPAPSLTRGRANARPPIVVQGGGSVQKLHGKVRRHRVRRAWSLVSPCRVPPPLARALRPAAEWLTLPTEDRRRRPWSDRTAATNAGDMTARYAERLRELRPVHRLHERGGTTGLIASSRMGTPYRPVVRLKGRVQ